MAVYMIDKLKGNKYQVQSSVVCVPALQLLVAVTSDYFDARPYAARGMAKHR